MSKLIDTEKLARLAKALDARAKAAVKAEETRALAAEKAIDDKAVANATAIAAINNEETGILKQAKDYADAEVKKVNDAKVDVSVYNAKMTDIGNKDDEQDGLIQGLDAAVKQIQKQIGEGDLTGVQEAIDKAVEDLTAADTRIEGKADDNAEAIEALQGRADALEAKVGHDKVEGDESQDATGLFAEVDEAKAAVVAEKERAEGQEAAIRQEMADEATRVNQKIANDIAAESALRVAEEQRIEGLVNQEVQDRKDAVAGVQADLDVAEEKIEALEALFAGDNSVDNKIAAVQKAVDDEKARAEEAEGDLQEAIEAEAAEARKQEGILAQADADEKAAREAADNALDARIKVFEEGENSVAKQIEVAVKAEADLREAADNALEARVKVNEDKLAGLEKATVKAEIEAAQAAAEKHADDAITALVDSAPDAMNTLNELAKAINDNQGVYDAYVAEHAQAMAQQKADLQKEIDDDIAAARTLISQEIDDDVKAEADRAAGEEAEIRQEFAAADAALKQELQAEIDADVKVEADRAVAKENELQAAINVLNGADNEAGSVAKAVKDAVADEAQRAAAEELRIENAYKAADVELDGRLDALESLVGIGGEGQQQNALQVMQGEIDAVEEEVADLKEEDLRLQGEINNKVAQDAYDTKVQALEAEDARVAGLAAAAQSAAEAAQADADALEPKVEALEGFMNGHDHKPMEDDIAANAAAIEAEVKEGGDRDQAIAAALEAYATETEMLAIIGQVVNSLALTMENNKMVLKLGGTEGVAIHEVSLDMATDDDIDAIIAGLDTAAE